MDRSIKLIFLGIFKSDNFIINILNIFFIVIFTLFILDIFLWMFFPIPLDQEIKVEMYQNIPGLKSKVLYERNKFGLRSLSMKTIEVPKNTYRIICVGGSTTDQVTQNTEDTWAGILELELQKVFKGYGIKIEVASYGRGGETVMDGCVWIRENLYKFNPNMVITMEGINDLCWHGGVGYKYKRLNRKTTNMRESFIGSVKGSAKFSFKQKCLIYSQICRRVRIIKNIITTKYLKKKGRIVEWHTKNLPNLREKYRTLPYILNPKREPDPIEEFSDGLFILADFVRKAKAALIILGQPGIWNRQMTPEEISSLWFSINASNGSVRPSPIWLEKEIKRYNEVQRRIAYDFKSDFIDLDKKIPKNLIYFFDDCHFKDVGSEFVASELLPYVKKHILKFVILNKISNFHCFLSYSLGF